MKHFLVLKLIILMVMIGIGFTAYAPAEVSKQYVEVTLTSGKIVQFEYRSFMEKNLPILPEKEADSPSEQKWFGDQRVIFQEKDSCEQHNIGLDNLREIEVLGVTENPCSKKKDWLYKLYLLDLDKYVGFFKSGDANMDKPLAEYGVTGQVLNQSETVTLQFEEIEKITFFAM